MRVEGSVWREYPALYRENWKPPCASRVSKPYLFVFGSGRAYYREHIEDWLTALNASFQKKAARNGLSDTNLELRVIGRNAALGALENLMR